MINQQIIEAQGNLYQVKRRFPEGRINLTKGNVSDLKIYFHCDTMFKAKGYLWLCNKIKDVSYEELR